MVKVVAIDGPVSSGKGVISRLVAARLGWHILESGILYRVLAYNVMQARISLTDVSSITTVAKHLDLLFVNDKIDTESRILVAGKDVTVEVRSEYYGDIASQISEFAAVRQALLDRQRMMARDPGLVADGRDMGTVVFPNAQWKFFLTASAKARAHRRYKQLQDKAMNVNLAQLLREITERDRRDQTRPISPLRPANDAILIDSTYLTVGEVVSQIIDCVIF